MENNWQRDSEANLYGLASKNVHFPWDLKLPLSITDSKMNDLFIN